MKKTGILILVICTLLFSSCSSSSNQNITGNTGLENTTSSVDKTTSSENNPVQENSPSDVSVRIASWRFGTYEKEDDVLIIEYEWTNNSGEAKSFIFTIDDKVFQNGIECGTLYGYRDVDSAKKNNKIQPGVTYTVEVAYLLQDKTAASVELTKYLGSDVYLHERLDLGGGDGIISADSNAKTTVEVTGIDLSEDYKGDTVLVAEFTFTNGENKPKAFLYLFRVTAFQHGVECDNTVIGCDKIDGSRWLNDVQPGVTYTLTMGFHISDLSEVTIEVTDFMGENLYHTTIARWSDEDQANFNGST